MENRSKDALNKVKAIIDYAENFDEINEQWFLNWLDELNKLSVKY